MLSSMMNIEGYTIIVAPYKSHPRGGDWIVRCYRRKGGDHIHSAEGGVSLAGGLAECQRAISEDMAAAAAAAVSTPEDNQNG